MKYINEYLRKKKPETFVDYNPGEIPKKTETSVGAIHESPAKESNSRASSIPAETYNTYTTSNKDLQNIHRNRTNAERHTGRSLRDVSNRRTTYVGDDAHNVPHFHTDSMESYNPRRGGVPSPPALFPYDYGRAQRPSPTNSNDGNHIAITNENNSSNPYGSPVKIVGDNVTKKDYDDFWNAFHEESTGEKLNWAANQMQTQPKAQEKTQRQSTPQNRRSQNMMQWAMQEREKLVKPQSLGRKRYITDEDEAFYQGFFGEDYQNNERLQRQVNSAIEEKNSRRTGDTLREYLAPENNITEKFTKEPSGILPKKIYDVPEPGRYGRLSSEEGQKMLDNISMALSAGSLIPGVDTFTDFASIPVDLLRGDYMSAAFDAVGLIPLVGEVGDTAKLARIGANAIDATSDARRAVKAGAELIENADDAIDFAKYTDDIYDSSKNTVNSIYSVVADEKSRNAYPLASKYVNSSEPIYRNADNIKPIDGYEDILIHGDASGFSYKDKNGKETNCTAREFAEMIRANPNYKGGPIRLISCETGADEFGAAQMLANQLGVEVMAPSHTAWVMPDGEIRIGITENSNEGVWKIFKPRGDKWK